MDHEELFNCIAIITTVSFFSLNAEMDNRGIQSLLPFPNSHEPAVKSEYKSPFYKLWQYVLKNKPSPHSDRVVYSCNKKYSHTQRLFALYQYSPEKFKKSENYIQQSVSIVPLKWLSLKNHLFFYKHNRHHIDGILAYARSILKRKRIDVCKRCSKLKKLTSYIHRNTMWQRSERPRKLDVCINESFHNWVWRL